MVKYKILIYNGDDIIEINNSNQENYALKELVCQYKDVVPQLKLILFDSISVSNLVGKKIEYYRYTDADVEMKRFSGHIEEINDSIENGEYGLICFGEMYKFSKRFYSGNFVNADLGAILRECINIKCPEFDISNIPETLGVVYDNVVADNIKLLDFFNDLFRENYFKLRIEDNVVYVDNSLEPQVSGLAASDANVIKNSINVKRSGFRKINKVIVKGGGEINTKTVSLKYTEQTNIFYLSEPVFDTNSIVIQKNSVDITDYILASNNLSVEIPGLVLNDIINITYSIKNPIRVVRSLANVAVSEIFEDVIVDDTITTRERAERIAEVQLNKRLFEQVLGDISIIEYNTNFKVNQTMVLSLSQGEYNDVYNIAGFSEKIRKNKFSIKLMISESLDDLQSSLYNTIADVEKLKRTLSGNEAILTGEFFLSSISSLSKLNVQKNTIIYGDDALQINDFDINSNIMDFDSSINDFENNSGTEIVNKNINDFEIEQDNLNVI